MTSHLLKRIAITQLMTLALLIPFSIQAAQDVFLKLADIQGESQDRNHQGEIDVLSWSWGLKKSETLSGQRRGLMLSPTCVKDITIVKLFDLASPPLIVAGVTGQVFERADLTVRQSGESRFEYLQLEIFEVSVSTYTTETSRSDDRPTETLTLNFESISGTYTPQRADGSAGDSKTFEITGNNCP